MYFFALVAAKLYDKITISCNSSLQIYWYKYRIQFSSEREEGISWSSFSLSWRWILEEGVVGGTGHVSVMDQSSTVDKLASSLSVTQSMASEEWKFSTCARLSPPSLYNAALVCSVTFRHHTGGRAILRSLLIECCRGIWIMSLSGKKTCRPNPVLYF